jgi:hypothetical protein
VTFNRLNDAHTRYTPPVGFSLCQINRQYAVDIAQQGNTAFFRGIFGFNANFDGAQILTIDGLTPLQYFQVADKFTLTFFSQKPPLWESSEIQMFDSTEPSAPLSLNLLTLST